MRTTTIRYSSQSKWADSYFSLNPATAKYQCGYVNNNHTCNHQYSISTKNSNKVTHLVEKHGLTIPSYLLPKQPKLKFEAKKITTDDAVVMAFCMNPTMSIRLIEDEYFRAAFCSNIVMSRDGLTKLIFKKSEEIKKKMELSIKNTVRCLIADGGKDISKNKLIAIGLADGKSVNLLKLVDTELQELNQQYFSDLFDDIVEEMDALSCFVAGIVVDNEASQSSGIKHSKSATHLLHFRCGAHTLELLVDALSQHYKGLENSIELAKEVANSVLNCKILLKNFDEIQEVANPGKNPLKLLLPSNTRKWNSGYLMLDRMLKVRRCLDLLSVRENMPELPYINWRLIQSSRDVLYEFYIRLQSLQQNRSNVIILSQLWEEILAMVNQSITKDAATIQDVDELKRKSNLHHKKILSSGVHHLCRAMWPSANLTAAVQKLAFSELEKLVDKQYLMWIKFRSSVNLPDKYNAENKNTFLLDARADLYQHLQPASNLIRTAKQLFEEETSDKNLLNLGPKVEEYWRHSAYDFRSLSVIYTVLAACPATEASAERFFSYEKIVHSELRNRMNPDLVNAILTVKCNEQSSKNKNIINCLLCMMTTRWFKLPRQVD